MLTKFCSFKYIISTKSNFKWTQVEQNAFEKIERIVDRDTLLTYPDFNEIFKINTNASAFQLGAVISKKGKNIACYIRKLTNSQKRHKVT